MEYTIKAHPTMYNGVQFRSRLEARWAAFFDQALSKRGLKWKWQYEPLDLFGWSPDFRLEIPLRMGCASFWVEIKPYYNLQQFKDHMSEIYIKQIRNNTKKNIFIRDWLQVDGILQLGADPSVSRVIRQICIIEGRPNWLQEAIDNDEEGVETWRDEPEWGIENCLIIDDGSFFEKEELGNFDQAWKHAGNLTQWKK